jgi:hypothetical protein
VATYLITQLISVPACGIVVGSFILPASHGTYYMREHRWNEWHHIINATFIMVPQSPMDSNDSMLVLFGGIVASSIVLDVDGTVAALGNAWCIIGSSHSGLPDG